MAEEIARNNVRPALRFMVLEPSSSELRGEKRSRLGRQSLAQAMRRFDKFSAAPSNPKPVPDFIASGKHPGRWLAMAPMLWYSSLWENASDLRRAGNASGIHAAWWGCDAAG